MPEAPTIFHFVNVNPGCNTFIYKASNARSFSTLHSRILLSIYLSQLTMAPKTASKSTPKTSRLSKTPRCVPFFPLPFFQRCLYVLSSSPQKPRTLFKYVFLIHCSSLAFMVCLTGRKLTYRRMFLLLPFWSLLTRFAPLKSYWRWDDCSSGWGVCNSFLCWLTWSCWHSATLVIRTKEKLSL